MYARRRRELVVEKKRQGKDLSGQKQGKIVFVGGGHPLFRHQNKRNLPREGGSVLSDQVVFFSERSSLESKNAADRTENEFICFGADRNSETRLKATKKTQTPTAVSINQIQFILISIRFRLIF